MSITVEDIKNEIVDWAGELAGRFGFPRTVGMLKALLWLTKGPLSLDEMADILEVSKASVSTNIRFLERWKVVRRVYNRGDRKNYYEFRDDIWEIETELVRTLAEDAIQFMRKFLERCGKNLGDMKTTHEAEEDAIKFVHERFEEALEYIDAGEHILRLLMKQGEVTPAVIKKIKID